MSECFFFVSSGEIGNRDRGGKDKCIVWLWTPSVSSRPPTRAHLYSGGAYAQVKQQKQLATTTSRVEVYKDSVVDATRPSVGCTASAGKVARLLNYLIVLKKKKQTKIVCLQK